MSKKLISIGQLIDHSWDLYRENFGAYLSISAWLLIVAILNVIALAFYPSASTLIEGVALTGWENFGVTLFALTAYVVSPLIMFWIFVALTRATRLAKQSKSGNIKKAIKEVKPRFIPAIIVTLLVFLILLGAQLVGLVPFGVVAALGVAAKSTGLLIFANLLLILGMIFSAFLLIRWTVFYILAPYANVLDDIQRVDAVKTSRKLVKGRFISVTFLLVVPKLVFVLFGVFALVVIAYLVQIAATGFSGLNTDLYVRLLSITDSVVPIIIVVLINPLIIISDVLLYKSLKGDEV